MILIISMQLLNSINNVSCFCFKLSELSCTLLTKIWMRLESYQIMMKLCIECKNIIFSLIMMKLVTMMLISYKLKETVALDIIINFFSELMMRSNSELLDWKYLLKSVNVVYKIWTKLEIILITAEFLISSWTKSVMQDTDDSAESESARFVKSHSSVSSFCLTSLIWEYQWWSIYTMIVCIMCISWIY